MTVTAEDILQGAINHETGINVLCQQDAPDPADVWPGSTLTSDYTCDHVGGSKTVGWAYGDHIWLRRTDAQIAADVASKVLTPIQGIYAVSMAHYGAVTMDNLGDYGPTFAAYVDGGDPKWADVGQKYGLPNNGSSYEINLSLPVSYMHSYVHVIDSCVKQGSCK
jgi:hypothetical protein